MKIAEYKIVDYQISYIEHEATEEAEAYTEEIKKPIYATVYREMTEEEIAQMQNVPAIEIEEETTIEDLVEAIDILTNIVLGGAE